MVPSITLTVANPTANLSPYFPNFAPETFVSLTVNAASTPLPAGVTIDNSIPGYRYNLTSGSVVVGGMILDLNTSSPSSAAADFAARMAGSNVVWGYKFDTPAEVNQFRHAGTNDPGDINNPGLCFWDNTDGVGSAGCLHIKHLADHNDPPHWWRPYAALNAPGNGLSTNDPAANNTVPRKTWAPTNNGNQTFGWNQGGWYQHASYSGTQKDGVDFWIQVVTKAPANEMWNGEPGIGKRWWICTTRHTACPQQIVTYGKSSNGSTGSVINYHQIYQDAGSNPYGTGSSANTDMGQFLTGTTQNQIGSELNGTGSPYLDNYHGTNLNRGWAYSGGWDTLLYHFSPGVDQSLASPTHLDVYAQHDLTQFPGEVGQYVRIWNIDYFTDYSSDGLDAGFEYNGWNAITLANYWNGFDWPNTPDVPVVMSHKFAQIIFSKAFIPPRGA